MTPETQSQIQQDIRMFRGVATLLAIIIVLSTIFFHMIEGWKWLDSFYFSVVTVATVGYGDFAPKTDPGKIGAIVVVVLGIGAFATFASLLLKRQGQIREKRRHKD